MYIRMCVVWEMCVCVCVCRECMYICYMCVVHGVSIHCSPPQGTDPNIHKVNRIIHWGWYDPGEELWCEGHI